MTTAVKTAAIKPVLKLWVDGKEQVAATSPSKMLLDYLARVGPRRRKRRLRRRRLRRVYRGCSGRGYVQSSEQLPRAAGRCRRSRGHDGGGIGAKTARCTRSKKPLANGGRVTVRVLHTWVCDEPVCGWLFGRDRGRCARGQFVPLHRLPAYP